MTPSDINLNRAYFGGAMTPEDEADFEYYVSIGEIELANGMSLKKQPNIQQPVQESVEQPVQEIQEPGQQPVEQPVQEIQEPGQQVASWLTQTQSKSDVALSNAYFTGQMTPEEESIFEEAALKGEVRLPAGKTIKQKEQGFWATAGDMVSGSIRSTPEIESLPDWGQMPEMNSMSWESFKTAAGTLMTDPEETMQVLKNNYPNLEIRHDAMGNYILKSSIDGKEYGFKPGFRLSDIPRAAGSFLAFTPAGKAATLPLKIAGAAATQGAIEASQAAAGGKFDVEQVPLAGATELILPGVRKIAGRMRSAPTLKGDNYGVSMGKLAEKALRKPELKGKYAEPIVEQVKPDLEMLASAERLGIKEYIQPDHVTTNQQYRELARTIKKRSMSESGMAEADAILNITEKANDAINKISDISQGNIDLSMLDETVKNSLSKAIQETDAKANVLYKQINDAIDPNTEAPADNLISFIRDRASKFGGLDKVSPEEKRLYRELMSFGKDEPSGYAMITPAKKTKHPTYAYLDNLRKELTRARVRKEGPFKESSYALIKSLEKRLLKDQQKIAQKFGVLDQFNTARTTVAIRKSIEKDMTSLFGKELNNSFLVGLSGSMNAISKGNVTKFNKIINAVPSELRKDVVMGGLAMAMRKTNMDAPISITAYHNWYNNLKNRNPTAFTSLMLHLPEDARKTLDDIDKVFGGIKKAIDADVHTGKYLDPILAMNNYESTSAAILKTVLKLASIGGVTAGLGAYLELPWYAITSMLSSEAMGGVAWATTKNKQRGTQLLNSLDTLFTHPHYIEAATSGTKKDLSNLKNSKEMKKLIDIIEAQLLGFMQGTRQALGGEKIEEMAVPEQPIQEQPEQPQPTTRQTSGGTRPRPLMPPVLGRTPMTTGLLQQAAQQINPINNTGFGQPMGQSLQRPGFGSLIK